MVEDQNRRLLGGRIMNNLTQISQGQNLPETKFQKLFALISNSNLPITGSAVAANLCQISDICEAIKDGDLKANTLDAVLALTEQHLYSIDCFMDSAICIYSFVDFQNCKKLANDLLLAIQSFKFCTLTSDEKNDFLFGLFLSSLKLEERIYALDAVVRQNEERING